MSNATLDISNLSRKTPAVLLPLLVLVLVAGKGSGALSASQLLTERLLKLVPTYPWPGTRIPDTTRY